MRRVLKLLARLYPADWRARYGAEYEALLEEREPRWRDVFDVMWAAMKMHMTTWRFVRVVLPCVFVGGLVAVAISFVAPPKYASETTFMVAAPPPLDQVCGGGKDLPSGLQGGRPVVCADGRTFQNYWKSASGEGFSREFLASVIQREGLYPRERAHQSLDVVIGKMRGDIHVETPQAGSERQFAVRFDYPDPYVAERVDNDLAAEVIVRVKNEQQEDFLKAESNHSQELTKLLQGRLRVANSASEVRELRAGIRQALALHSGLERIRPLTAEALGLKAASFSQRPDGLSRTQLGAIGLVGGLACGIMLAAVFGWRRGSTLSTAD
jgi:hypothetical protein